MTVFSSTYVSFLDPATTKELKKKEFTTKSQNINQENGIHMTFLLEIKLQKFIF